MTMKAETADELFKWVSILGGEMKADLDRELAPLGLSSCQFFYILIICGSPGMTRDSLFQDAHRDPSNITRALEHLEESGFFTRTQCDKDKRTYHLHPTEKAYLAREGIYRALQRCAERAFAGFGEDEIDSFVRMAKRAGSAALDREVTSQ